MSRALLRKGAWAALALLACAVHAQAADEEQLQLESKLQEKKAALSLLQSQRVSALEVMDLFQRLSSASARRAFNAERRMKAIQKRVEFAERQNAWARSAFERQASDVSPRLLSLYRLLRQNPLQPLLSTVDLTALLRQRRQLHEIVEADLATLARMQRLAQFQEQSREEMEFVKTSLSSQLAWQKIQASRLRQQQRDLLDLAELIRAEASRSRGFVRELEQADRDLSRSLTNGSRVPGTSGFAALFGRLPMPAEGMIEVGFGKVVNPRFHTTTVQKGLDIHAPEGAPVRAIASGKVVYAGWLVGYGNVLILDHGDGYHSLMAHLRETWRAVGQGVQAGDQLGTVGDTGSLKGAYLYFELRQKGMAVDPVPWLEATHGPSASEAVK
jgi:murein hydrolase activator